MMTFGSQMQNASMHISLTVTLSPVESGSPSSAYSRHDPTRSEQPPALVMLFNASSYSASEPYRTPYVLLYGTSCGNKLEDHWLNIERRRLRIELVEREWAFEASRKDLLSRSATTLLSIQKMIMQTTFDKEVDGPSEMQWDKYLPRFEEAVTLAETFMELGTASAPSTPGSCTRR